MGVLEKLSATAFRVLKETSIYTPTHELLSACSDKDALTQHENWLDLTCERCAPEIEAAFKRLMNRGPDDFACGRYAPEINNLYAVPVTPIGIAHSLLLESCRMALSEKPPPAYLEFFMGLSENDDKNDDEDDDEDDDVVSANIAKGGRPTKQREQELVQHLASVFVQATGRKATYTDSGPFDEFLSACLQACNLKEGERTNRKLIQKALYKTTRYIPKPRKKK